MNFLIFLIALFVIAKTLNKVAPYCPFFLQRSFQWFHAIIFELAAVILSIFMRLFCYLFPNKKQFGNKNGTPILLIHGYLHNSSGWFFFQRALAKNNVGPIFTIDLFHPFLPIAKYAEKIREKAEQIRNETGKEDLILIGHSMGGLIASYYATHLAKNPLKVITLGSPLQGTLAALLALGPNGKEMRRRSLFVTEMQTIFQQSQIPFYHLGSMADQLILPASSAFTQKDPKKECRIPDLGHMSLLYSPRVISQVSTWIHH